MQIPATSMDEYDEPLRLVGLTTAGGRKCQSDIAMSRPCTIKKAALEKDGHISSWKILVSHYARKLLSAVNHLLDLLDYRNAANEMLLLVYFNYL